MLRRFVLAAVALGLVACSNCNSPCKEGITFNVAEVAGSLARGSSEPLHVCFDGSCQDVTITRELAGSSIFLPFTGVGKNVDHDLTVTGVGSFTGEYKGKLAGYVQKGSGGCASCSLATVKIGADGKLTPGVPAAPAPTTTVGAATPTSTVTSP